MQTNLVNQVSEVNIESSVVNIKKASQLYFVIQTSSVCHSFCTTSLQVPPPSIDFVLPSPTIGLPVLPIIDPPWMPHFKTKVEEVTINQTESVSWLWSFQPVYDDNK